MAEGILNDILLDEARSGKGNLPIRVKSAGTHAVQGLPPSENAILTTSRHGIDISHKRSESFSNSHAREADLILTMEVSHTEYIKQHFPSTRFVSELTSFGREYDTGFIDREIDDPIGMDLFFYETIFKKIRTEIVRITDILFSLAGEKAQGN